MLEESRPPWRPACALCMSQSGPESEAVTVAAGFAVCRRHRNAIMTKDLGDLIEQVLFETRPTPPPPGPKTVAAMRRGDPVFGPPVFRPVNDDATCPACGHTGFGRTARPDVVQCGGCREHLYRVGTPGT
jgi:hypothetical protein